MTADTLSPQAEPATQTAAPLLEALDTAGVGYFTVDLTTRTVVRSPAVDRMYGFAPGEAGPGIDAFNERQLPEDRARGEALRAAMIAEGRRNGSHEYRVRWPDGTVRWLSLHGAYTFGPDGLPVQLAGILMDVTEQRQTEAALRESEGRLGLALDASELGIWDWDLTTNATLWSGRFREIYGIGPDVAAGPDVSYGRIHPDDRPMMEEATRQILASDGGDLAREYRVVHPDGSVRWIAGHARAILGVTQEGIRPVRMIGTIRDITDRKQAEERGNLDAERLRQATRAANLGTWELDAATGSVDLSPESRTMLGFSTETEVTRQVFFTAIHPDDRQEVGRRVDRALDPAGDGAYQAEFRFTRPDGSLRWISAYGRALFEDGPDGRRAVRLIGTNQDISERREAEERLRASEERLNAVVETAVDGIVTIDAAGRIVTLNSAVERLFGYERAELIGLNVSVLMPEPYRSQHDGYLAHHLATGEQRIIGIGRDVTGRCKDGSIFPMSLSVGAFEHGGQRFFTGIIRDITDRRRAERQNERLGRIVEDAASEIYIFDATTLRFVRVNRGARDNLGYTMGELERLTPLDLKPEFTLDAFETMIAPLRDGREERIVFETVHLRKDGSTYDVAVTLQLMRGEAEPVFFAAIRDITEEKQARERQELLVGELNHRVKNMLATVQALAAQTTRSAVSLDAFATVFGARLRALSRAHELLTRGVWHGADLRDVAGEALDVFGIGSDRITIDGPSVHLRPTFVLVLSMALHELATNAAKYGALSAPGGHVSLTWMVRDTASYPGTLALQWIERGGPPVAPPARRGFGSQLIERAVQYQLRGTVHLDFAEGGLCCDMTIPLGEPAG